MSQVQIPPRDDVIEIAAIEQSRPDFQWNLFDDTAGLQSLEVGLESPARGGRKTVFHGTQDVERLPLQKNDLPQAVRNRGAITSRTPVARLTAWATPHASMEYQFPTSPDARGVAHAVKLTFQIRK